VIPNIYYYYAKYPDLMNIPKTKPNMFDYWRSKTFVYVKCLLIDFFSEKTYVDTMMCPMSPTIRNRITMYCVGYPRDKF